MRTKIGGSLALLLLGFVVTIAALGCAMPQAHAAGWTIDPDGGGR
ncbi:MAG: hypothetical protein K0S54_1613 [Alphaproteobacteria bacterium]|nr:hypothetical protein [Alphaproteobacteria bacterium]